MCVLLDEGARCATELKMIPICIFEIVCIKKNLIPTVYKGLKTWFTVSRMMASNG